ncbi:DUF6113 family protein [Actinocorallia longicatena]|uniref:SPW repeat-containing protein n=1 Tax=Actinocorallia longicatena TaxID=111803 RepID=A0ABP6Q205_9ACTN
MNRLDSPLNAALYLALGLFGVLWGLIGSFTYSHSLAVTFALSVGNLVLFRLAGWGAGTRAAAVVPTLAWLTTVMIFSLPKSEGDVIFPSTISGQVYLFLLGGAAAGGLAIYLTPATRSFLTGLPHDPSSRAR